LKKKLNTDEEYDVWENPFVLLTKGIATAVKPENYHTVGIPIDIYEPLTVFEDKKWGFQAYY
jgi:hypothetical protein